MTPIVIGTSNRGKFLEIHAALKTFNIPLLSLKDFPDVHEAPETGHTFEEIARNKAAYYFEKTRLPVLAEDSGLVIPALDGFPGIFSARVAETDCERIRIILEKLQGQNDRIAFYHCSMVFWSSHTTLESEGRCDGTIAISPRGNLGFGYDPVFIPQNSERSFGEMTLEEKELISHRGIALQRILPQLQAWVRNNS